MKNTAVRALVALATIALVSGCAAPAPEAAPAPAAESAPALTDYRGDSDLDIVERLPQTVPDARIRYDDSALTYGDLRLPRGSDSDADDKLPLVVLLHGGAWESSYSAEYMGRLAEALTQSGAVTWNLEFRRLNNPGSDYPGMFLDVAHGIDHVRTLAQTYPIDLDRVVVVGHSSGGHLATWAAARAGIPADSELHTADPLPLAGVVDLAGVLDLEAAFAAGRTDILDVLGVTDAAGVAERSRYASSIEVLPSGSGTPQTLIIGSQDSPWRLESQERYRDAAAAAGDEVDLVVLDGANHFDVVDVCSRAWTPLIRAVSDYLDLGVDEAASERAPAVCAS